MKRPRKKSASKKSKDSLAHSKAPNFNEVVAYLRNHGIKAIRKRKFRLLGEDMVPDTYLGPCYDLSEPEVTPPDFWVPVGHDGSGWQAYLCVPPWLENDPVAPDWYLTWRDAFKVGSSTELSGDHEHFVHGTLADLEKPIHLIWHVDGMSEQEISACDLARGQSLTLLRRAMEEAHALDQGSRQSAYGIDPPCGMMLPLSHQIAMVIETAFRAGIHFERMAWYGRNVSGVARKAMPLVAAQKTTSTSRLNWTKKAEEMIRQNPKIKPRDLAIALMKEEIVFTTDEWETVDFEDGTPAKSFDAFSRAVSRIRSRVKKL
jgi:hypothetical protein